MIAIEEDRCTGCRLCELACSYRHEGVFQPSTARVRVRLFSKDGHSFPQLCLQCPDAPCLNVCKQAAISRDPEAGTTDIDNELCTGCKQCLSVCPYGGMAFSPTARKAVVCDLCQGDPACVQYCFAGALSWIDAESCGGKKTELLQDAASRQAAHGANVK